MTAIPGCELNRPEPSRYRCSWTSWWCDNEVENTARHGLFRKPAGLHSQIYATGPRPSRVNQTENQLMRVDAEDWL